MNEVVDKDYGFARIVTNIHNLAREMHVTIGVHEREGAAVRGQTTMAEIAATHEYGCPDKNIPQRSFIRDTHDLFLKENLALLKRLEARVFKGAITEHQALTLLGEVASKQMVSRINQGIGPALKPETIRRKKSSKPLIDTGQLKGSIRFKVES